jgi:glutamate---cysteine ligase / carboxylate-amine ligase
VSGSARPRPDWATWAPSDAYTVGVEEEVMLLDPDDWTLAQEIDAVMPELPDDLAARCCSETHGAVMELTTGVHQSVGGALRELGALRRRLLAELDSLHLCAAGAGTHPTAVWYETEVAAGKRHQMVYGSMRELARREPTFGLHVHVGVPTPQQGIDLYNRMRAHLPLLLALSANSPFWQGRDTGLASARTPLFQAFPRVGMPRRFASYDEYAETVDLLVRCEAFPEPSFLWWDVRPSPGYGTVEVRIMDTQTELAHTEAIVALVQCIAHLELEEGWISDRLVAAPEVLIENRFLAARDGMGAALVDPDRERRVPAREQLADLLAACAPYAEALGCSDALAGVARLTARPGARTQLAAAAEEPDLAGLVARLAGAFV